MSLYFSFGASKTFDHRITIEEKINVKPYPKHSIITPVINAAADRTKPIMRLILSVRSLFFVKARQILPPSNGKTGKRLNAARAKFAVKIVFVKL